MVVLHSKVAVGIKVLGGVRKLLANHKFTTVVPFLQNSMVINNYVKKTQLEYANLLLMIS
jgi:hypothetical protein